jgi:adenine phosphoribosyltransferase
MKDEMNRMIGTFEGIPIVKKGDYHYFVHPLSDGIPIITPQQLKDAVTCIRSLLPPLQNFDLFITAEAMGIPLTTLLSQEVSKPFSIARKRKYGMDGEIKAKQSTGYSTSDIYLNLPRYKGRAVIIDDVLSTGGTLVSLANGMKDSGWDIECAVILFNKMGEGRYDLEKELDFPILTLLNVELFGEAFKAERSH